MGVGALHWDPPAEAIAEAATHATEPSHCSYVPDEGLTYLTVHAWVQGQCTGALPQRR